MTEAHHQHLDEPLENIILELPARARAFAQQLLAFAERTENDFRELISRRGRRTQRQMQ